MKTEQVAERWRAYYEDAKRRAGSVHSLEMQVIEELSAAEAERDRLREALLRLMELL